LVVVLWQVLAGTRGGPNRVRVLRALDRRPRNANQLADELDLSYKTVRHHLDVLEGNQLVKSSDGDYKDLRRKPTSSLVRMNPTEPAQST
jgi:DNA-binding transcriptional ArsR family regulator